MRAEDLVDIIGAEFYTGVPDSQLKALCNLLMDRYGIDPTHHVIAANEGNCVGLAAGYHLATGKFPVVYMQNSGEGNIINPVASLLNEKVYGIPVIFIVGWRGEPGVHDEPQHIYQGEVTIKLLEDMGIETFIIGRDTTDDEVKSAMNHFREVLCAGNDVAFVVRKGALTFDGDVKYENRYTMIREEVIRRIVSVSQSDVVVSTTGKASRELFEIREANGQEHGSDFLTVGSMGHSSSIALGVALNKPDSKVWCIDGDGAVLMHMGAMAVIGANRPANLVHVVINNGAHETVGGMPTVAGQTVAGVMVAGSTVEGSMAAGSTADGQMLAESTVAGRCNSDVGADVGLSMDMVALAKACGYPKAVCVESYDRLDAALEEAKAGNELTFIEVRCAIGSRADLGRPTLTAKENKENFVEYLRQKR